MECSVTEKDLKKEKVSFIEKFSRKRIRNKDFYLGLVLFFFSLSLLFYLIPYHIEIMQADGMAVTPSFFPYLIDLCLLFLSLLLMMNSPRTGGNATRAEDKQANWGTLVLVALMFFYYFGMKIIGMAPMSGVVLFVLMRLFGYRKWTHAVIFSIAFTVLIYLFFEKFAQVDIPRGILFDGWY
jgi:hypothetical protein